MNLQFSVQVPKSPQLDQLINRFTHKLEPHLYAFNPDLVQLHGRLIRHREREGVVCSLNLHLPTTQLSSEATAPVAQQAFREAGSELLRRFHTHMEKLRGIRVRIRTSEAFAESPGTAPILPSALAEQDGERRRREDLGAYLAKHVPELTDFIARQLRVRVRLGDVGAADLEPPEVLDEVVVLALTASAPQPVPRNRLRWFRTLAAKAIHLLAHPRREDEPEFDGGSLEQELSDPAQLKLHFEDWVEPDEAVTLQDVLAVDAANPETIAYTEELIDGLAAALQALPGHARNDWVLARIEGFTVAEIAVASARKRGEVEASIQLAERHLPDVVAALREAKRA